MKKLIFLAVASVLATAGMAAMPGSTGEHIDCMKIHIGISKARITLPNGEKRIMPVDQLESYQMDGAVFEKKELFVNGKPTGKTAFMQLLKTRDGLSLYKNEVIDPELASADKKRIEYYVYQGDKVYLDVTKEVLPNAVNFFGLKMASR